MSHWGRLLLTTSHGSSMIRLALRSAILLPARFGNINVHPLIYIVNAGALPTFRDRPEGAWSRTGRD